MAVLLAATGVFLYARTEHALTETLDDGLSARLADVADNVRDGRLRLADEAVADGEARAGGVQILEPGGAVRYATGSTGARALVPAARRRRLGAAPAFFDAARGGA